MNTAIARNKAWNYMEKRDYKNAYKYYNVALKKYPKHHPKSEYALSDKKELEEQKKIAKELMYGR